MSEITLGRSEIGCIATFQGITKTTPRDCIINDDDTITFVVENKDMGLAIGRKGVNVKNASKLLKKEVIVVEYSDDPVKFISNLMYPIKPKSINIEGKESKKIAKISVPYSNRAKAIGSRGKNINKLKKIVARHHNVSDIVIA